MPGLVSPVHSQGPPRPFDYAPDSQISAEKAIAGHTRPVWRDKDVVSIWGGCERARRRGDTHMFNLERQRPDVGALVVRVVRRAQLELGKSFGFRRSGNGELEGGEELQERGKGGNFSTCG